jgi:ankyrin repeat protein
MTSKIKYIKEIIKYDEYIDWERAKYSMEIFLNKYYRIKKGGIKRIFNYILEKRKSETIIIKSCLKGFNGYILKRLYNQDNNIINASENNRIAITESYNNNKLFNFLLKYGGEYNFIKYDNNILLKCIINNKQKKILKLLNIHDIDVNIFNPLRNTPAHLIFLYNMSFEIKYKILEKTTDLNFQNVDGQTILHYLFYYVKNNNSIKMLNIFIKPNFQIF